MSVYVSMLGGCKMNLLNDSSSYFSAVWPYLYNLIPVIWSHTKTRAQLTLCGTVSNLFICRLNAVIQAWSRSYYFCLSMLLGLLFQWLWLESHQHVPTVGKAMRDGCPNLCLSPDHKDKLITLVRWFLTVTQYHGTWLYFGVAALKS